MKIRVEIDDALMRRVMQLGAYSTPRVAIEAGLRLLGQVQAQKALQQIQGKISWEGDLEGMRRD